MSSFGLFIALVKRTGLLLVLAYLATRLEWFGAVLKGKVSLRAQLLLLVVFGALGSYGSMGGLLTMNTGANAGFIGPLVGGLLGGPLSGLGAGLIAGLQRYLYGAPIAKNPSVIAMIAAGLAGGASHLLTTRRSGRQLSIAQAGLVALGLQACHVTLIFLMTPPFAKGWALVRYIGLPTAFANTLGTAVIYFFLTNLLKEQRTREQRDHYLGQKLKIEGELAVAKDIQMSLVPKMFPRTPDWPGCSLYADLKSAREVGGDFYDFFLDEDGRLIFVIGDVSDKGVPAALFMAVTKTLIKGMCEPGQLPHELLEKVNRELEEGNDLNMFVTLFCAKLDFTTGELWYSNAGHNPPVLLRRGRAPQWLELPPGLVLGAFSGSRFQTRKLVLAPGDTLFAYTDGVTEAMDPAGAMYSEPRLLAELRDWEGTPRELVGVMEASVKTFAAGATQSDDVTLLAVKYTGASAPAAQEAREVSGLAGA